MPKHPALWSAHDVESGHQRRYTTASLRQVVTDAGFTVERVTSLFTALLAAHGGCAGWCTEPRGRARPPPRSPTRRAAGPLAGVLDRLLAHERRSLRRRTRRTGTSLLLVARR